MTSEDTVCYRPFNHLKFFAGPVIAAVLAGILRFIYLHSDPYAQVMATTLGFAFFLASIGVHVGCMLAYIDKNRAFKYRPTIVSAIVVSLIQFLMFTTFMMAILHLLKLPAHK